MNLSGCIQGLGAIAYSEICTNMHLMSSRYISCPQHYISRHMISVTNITFWHTCCWRRRMFVTNRFVTSSGQSVTSRLRSITSWHMFVTVNVSFNAYACHEVHFAAKFIWSRTYVPKSSCCEVTFHLTLQLNPYFTLP